MAIMIRVTELMAVCFWFLWKFIKIFYFLDCPPRILGGFTWRLQKEPPISNGKISISRRDTLFVCYLFMANTARGTDRRRYFSWWRILLASLQDDIFSGSPVLLFPSMLCWPMWIYIFFALSDLKVKWILPGITLCPYWPIAINFWTTRWVYDRSNFT